MSGAGGSYYSSDCESQSQARQAKQTNRHGASIAIVKHSCIIEHETDTSTRQVMIRSYKNGVRVGCTFITTEALEEIYRLHKSYLKPSDDDYVQHQAGY